jgi:hypothetical protein
LTLSDGGGKPITSSWATLELKMTTMIMPPDNVVMRRTAVGVYSGVGIFTMGGSWSAVATVKTNGKSATYGRFLLNVKD